MPLQELISYISVLCARKGENLYRIGERNGWPEETITEFLTGKRPPTAKTLRDMGREFEVSPDYLKRCLDR